MDNNEKYQESLKKIESALENMLVGKPSSALDQSGNEQLDRIIELVNVLSDNFSEMAQFSYGLAKGKLNIQAPGRRNYIAAPLKELHSQLSGMVWTVKQLGKGLIVDEIDYAGELSAALNVLIRNAAGEHPPADSCSLDFQASALSWQYHKVLLTVNHLKQILVITDKNHKVLFANKPANMLFGYFKSVRNPDEHDNVPILEQIMYSLSDDSHVFPISQEVYDEKQNSWFSMTTDEMPFLNYSTAFLHCIEDINERKLNENQLKISATVDPLTGVFNRAFGTKALETAMANKHETTSCIGFVDIDKLKYINDTFGHNEGDFAIKTIAQMLTKSVRQNDTVSRFGGDEFLVIFNDCTVEIAEKALNRLQDKLNAINDMQEKPYDLLFSHGVTQIDKDTSANAKQIIQLVDKKMYERKRAKNK